MSTVREQMVSHRSSFELKPYCPAKLSVCPELPGEGSRTCQSPFQGTVYLASYSVFKS
jgi:hypothetical protein